MMVSVQEPINRKRVLLSSEGSRDPKRLRNNGNEISDSQTNLTTTIINKPSGSESSSISSDKFTEKMYLTYVKSALDALDINDTLQIDTLASKIRLPYAHREAITINNFNITLKLLIANISKLDNKACSNLITSVLEYPWLKIDAKENSDNFNFIELYSHFLSILVSSFPKYLHEVTSKIIKDFTHNTHDLQHHKILNKIVKFIPTAVNSIPGNLQKQFPHHLATSTESLSNYVENLLKVLEYSPELQYDIWQMIIECCIKLDVELQNELDDLDDDEIDEIINGEEEILEVSEGENGEVDAGSDSDDEADDDENENDDDDERVGQVEYIMESTRSSASIKKILKKLDSIINLLLKKTESSFTTEELNHGNGVYLFNTLTSLFKTHILPTHFTKLIQFIIFHVSQYQPELADSYLVLLIDVAFNASEILEKRLKAMQYLASYIARAKNLSRHQIVFVVSYLIGWLNKYVIERECEVFESDNDNTRRSKSLGTGGMERFKLFYAAFQALLYIFCFRYNMLQKVGNSSSTGESEWECELDKFFQRAMISKFNPLKFCDETVVYIFAKIATKLNVCYCYSVIEHNKRERMIQTNGGASRLPSAVSNFKAKQEFLDLEAYFPFDPLVLPTSKKLISLNYVEWSDVNPNNDDDDDEEDSSNREVDSDEEITSESEDEY